MVIIQRMEVEMRKSEPNATYLAQAIFASSLFLLMPLSILDCCYYLKQQQKRLFNWWLFSCLWQAQTQRRYRVRANAATSCRLGALQSSCGENLLIDPRSHSILPTSKTHAFTRSEYIYILPGLLGCKDMLQAQLNKICLSL